MQNIQQVIEQISLNPDCKIYPPDFSIELPENTPSDLQEFYQITNGIYFDENSYAMQIVGRETFSQTNHYLYSQCNSFDEIMKEFEGNINNNWYIMAESLGDDFISVDLAPQCLGRVYDTFFQTYADVGDTPVIALSFTEFLTEMANYKGQTVYWREDNFISYGDAYDNI